jgi:hypothetical protein
VGNETYGKLTRKDVPRILQKYREAA